MIKIECKSSKKNPDNFYYVLTINGVYVSFDVPTIARAFKISPRDIYLLESGEYIEFEYIERS